MATLPLLQDIVVTLIALAAVFLASRRVLGFARPKSSASSCTKCVASRTHNPSRQHVQPVTVRIGNGGRPGPEPAASR